MEYLLLIINLGYGYLMGFILRFLRFKKISCFKDLIFSFLYIIFYIKLIDAIMIETNFYLLTLAILGFFLGYKYYYQKSISSFYELLDIIKKLLIKIIKPPFISLIIKKTKNKKQFYKTHPYLKKDKYELF